MFQKKVLAFLSSVIITTAFASCGVSPQYQDYVTIPHHAWAHNFVPEFIVDITDTAARYQLFFVTRHTDAYPYSNIWVSISTKAPGDTVFTKFRKEIVLAAPSGQWLGRGAGDIFESKIPINDILQPAVFSKKGEYTIRLSQDMRMNPLPEMLTAGIRIEKLSMNAPTSSPSQGAAK
jgi:gliding motility-associated lipoprotein GldH